MRDSLSAAALASATLTSHRIRSCVARRGSNKKTLPGRTWAIALVPAVRDEAQNNSWCETTTTTAAALTSNYEFCEIVVVICDVVCISKKWERASWHVTLQGAHREGEVGGSWHDYLLGVDSHRPNAIQLCPRLEHL